MAYKTYNTSVILLILALGGILQGLETTSMSIFIGSEPFIKFFSNPGSLAQGLIAGSNPVGAFVGCWICGLLSDHFGRVVTMQVASVIWVIGSLVSIFVVNLPMVIVGRAIKGLTVGMFSAILPVYIGDVFPDSKKGKATAIMQFCLTFGIMIMFYLSIVCDLIKDDRSFRMAWGLEALPGAILALFAFLLPESPKWLASKGKWSQASDIQNKIHKANMIKKEPIEKQDAEKKEFTTGNLEKIEGVLDRYAEGAQKCTYADLFKTELRPHLLVGILTQSMIQLSGIGVLMYYLVFICEMIGLSGNLKLHSASIQYILNVLFTFIPIMLMNRVRRKDVIVYGSLSLGTCIGAIGIIMGCYGHSVPPVGGNTSIVWEVNGTPGSICLALCYLFVSIFATTLSCAGWIYTNEIFPTRAKSKGSSVCMSVSWCMNFLLTFLAPVSLTYLRWGTFLVFSIFCFVGAIVIGLFCPETFNLQEHEINALFTPDSLNIKRDGENKPSRNAQSAIEVKPATLHDTEEENASQTTVRSRSSHRNGALPTILKVKTSTEKEDLRRAVSLTLASTQSNSGSKSSPFSRNAGSPFGNSELAEQNREEESVGHYYNMSSKESPFLNNYSQRTFPFD